MWPLIWLAIAEYGEWMLWTAVAAGLAAVLTEAGLWLGLGDR